MICGTCGGEGVPRLTKLKFRTVLIDEATHIIYQKGEAWKGWCSVIKYLDNYHVLT